MKFNHLFFVALICLSGKAMSQRVIDLDKPENISQSYFEFKKDQPKEEIQKKCKKYANMTIGGTVMMVGGIVMTAVSYKQLKKANIFEDEFSIGLMSFYGGITMATTGVVITSVGSVKSKKFCSNKSIMTVYVAPGNDGLALGLKF